MLMEVWIDPATNRIKAIYDGCSTTSTVWSDVGYVRYSKIEPWMLPHENPPPIPELRMSLHEARVLSIDTGAVKPITARLFQEGNTFDVDCYVTQDMVDAYQAGKLAVGDWVLVYFIDEREDKAIVQQKIYKTW